MKLICKFLFVTALIWNTNLVFSQRTFEVLFESPFEERLADITEDSAGNYYGVGVQRRDNPFRSYPILWKINSEGDTISKIFYTSDSIAGFHSIKSNEDGTLDILGYKLENDNRNFFYSTLHYKLNSDLTILQSELLNYSEYISTTVTQILYAKNKIYLFCQLINLDSVQKPGVVLLDNEFNLVSSKVYDYYLEGYISEAFFSPDSSQIWMYTKNFIPTKAVSPTHFFIIDTLLNEISIKALPANQYSDYSYFDNYLSGGVIDGDKLLFCGNFFHGTNIPLNTEFDIGLSKCDTSLNQLGLVVFGTSDIIDHAGAINASDYISLDSILICGTLKVGDGFFPNHPTFIILRLIDIDLNTLFERTFGGDAFYYTTNIIATSDGGCLIGAHRSELGSEWRRNTYLLKLNKEGLLTSTDIISTSELKPYNFYVNHESKQIVINLALPEATAFLYKLDASLLNTLSLKEGFNTIPIRENNSHLILLIKTPTKLFTEKI